MTRIAIGGVATTPWRARGAEAALKGSAIHDQSVEVATSAAFAGARRHEHNAFKVALGKRVLALALKQAAALKG